jgi:hypothetical protein
LWASLCATALVACPPSVNLPDGGEDNALVLTPRPQLFIRNGYALDVPANAVLQDTPIFITKIDMGVPEIADRKRISLGYRISPTNLRFSVPIKLYLTWEADRLVKAVDPGTYDMRRQSGSESFMNPLPGSRTNTVPFEAVEATTDRLGLFWLTSPASPNIDRLEIEPAQLNLRMGEMRALAARVVAPNGDSIEAQVTWSVVPPRVARVDAMGTVTALDPGVATVTARSGTKTATARVVVIREPPLPGPVSAAHENPFPTGNDLWSGAIGPAGLGTAFVGENGTVLVRNASNQWQRLFSTSGLSFRAIGGTNLSNVIAVGVSGTTGVAVELKGPNAAPQIRVFQPNSISELSALWFDGTHGMAAGSGNNLLAYRNNAWREENNPTLRRVMSVVGDGQGAFSVVNELGSIYRFDPTRKVWDSLFERELSVLLKAGQILDATTGESWAVGGGRLWHFANGAWSATNLPASLTTGDYTSLALFDGRVFIGGTRMNTGLIAAYDLSTTAPPSSDAGPVPTTGWSEFSMRGPQKPKGLFGGGRMSPAGFVVGELGAVWEWNALSKTFVEQSRGFYSDVFDLAATPTDVFVTVNECDDANCALRRGQILHQADGGFEPLGAAPSRRGFYAVVARPETDVIVATDDGFFRWDGMTWERIAGGVTGAVRDMKWCGDQLFAVGDRATVYVGNATQINPTAVGSARGDIHAISCPSPMEIWISGDEFLAQRSGNTWTARTSMMIQQDAWRTVFAPGGGEAWAFGDARYGVYWDTTGLTSQEAFPIPMDVATASWGTSVDSLYMVGATNPPIRFGFMMRFDGAQWRLIDSGSQRRVTTIDGYTTMTNGVPRPTLWLGTQGGGILRSVQ